MDYYIKKELQPLPQHLQGIPEQSTQCPNCHREIIRTWHFCPSCGERVNFNHIVQKLCMTDAENASHLLNGLINYHERAVGFRPDDTDHYVDALRYALLLVEERFELENIDSIIY